MSLLDFKIDSSSIVKNYLSSKSFKDQVTEVEFYRRLVDIDEHCKTVLDAAVNGVSRYDSTYLNKEEWAAQFNSSRLSFTPPNYHNRSGNLKASYCYGVYFRGTLRDHGLYHDGRTINYKDYYTTSDDDYISRDFDDKTGRDIAIEFLQNYIPSRKDICEIVFAAAVPYAKELESGRTWGMKKYDVITYAEEYALQIGGVKYSKVF